MDALPGNRLSEAELAATKARRAEGEASLACEGLFLTGEERALFAGFDRDALSHEERRRAILAFCRTRTARATAAE